MTYLCPAGPALSSAVSLLSLEPIKRKKEKRKKGKNYCENEGFHIERKKKHSMNLKSNLSNFHYKR